MLDNKICRMLLRRHHKKILQTYEISNSQNVEVGFEICKDHRTGPIHIGTKNKLQKFKKYCLYPLTYVHTHPKITEHEKFNISKEIGEQIEMLPSLRDLQHAELLGHEYSCVISIPLKKFTCVKTTLENIEASEEFERNLSNTTDEKIQERNNKTDYCSIDLL